MNHCTRLLFAAIAFAALATSQTFLVLPGEYERAWGRGSSSALGGDSTRTQMVFAQPFPSGTQLLGIGMRATASTSDRQAFTADIEVRVSSTSAVPGSLSSTFANNVGSDEVVVLPRQMYPIIDMPANRSTGRFAQITFANPFTFGTNGNTNLNVELLVYGRSAGASWSTDRAFATSNGRVTTAGSGCGGASVGSSSTGGSYVSGATVSVTLSSAAPGMLAYLIGSFDLKDFVPGLLLPFPLSNFGAPQGCDLMVNPSFGGVLYITDPAGAASTTFAIPAGFGQVGLGWQWLYLVPPSAGNPIGLESTAVRGMWIGPEVVVPRAQYVWDLFNVGSATGNATTDSVPIVQFLLP